MSRKLDIQVQEMHRNFRKKVCVFERHIGKLLLKIGRASLSQD